MDQGIIRSGSADIYYERHGDKGEYLVLLHGNNESMRRMQHQIDYFSKSYRVIAVDSRGHGESGFGQGELNLDTMSVDVENVLNGLGITKTNILGFSDGANIAMLLAIRRPELISAMVLVGGNLKPSGMTMGIFLSVNAAYYLTKLAGKFDKRLRLEHEFYHLMAKEPDIKPSSLKRITARTLVIAGDKDLIKPSHTHTIASNIPNARELILEGDHFIIYRTPEIINQAADKFFMEK